MKSAPLPLHIKEGASAQMLLLLEGRAPRNLFWARFGIQSRGLQKWEVLQVICFAGWGWGWEVVSGVGVRKTVLQTWSRLASWYSSDPMIGAVSTDWRNLEPVSGILTSEYQKSLQG